MFYPFSLTNRAVSTGDFTRDQQPLKRPRHDARALLVELTTLPITTSTVGFSFRFNPAAGPSNACHKAWAFLRRPRKPQPDGVKLRCSLRTDIPETASLDNHH